ncbi:MAG: CHAD domain-containing protein, partial [Alcanivorax sp.]|nr:CHAD domain-containing protein [Alcanivorax sp.]
MMTAPLMEQLVRQALILDEQALALLQSASPEADAIHDSRVAIKRLRALWQLLRPWLRRDHHKAFDHNLRDGARALSGARDTHVMATTLGKLAGKAGKPQRKAISRVQKTLFPADNHADSSVCQSATRESLQQDYRRWQQLSLVLSDHELLVSGLARTYKQCRNHSLAAQGSQQAQPWHALRKWVKYLLYQQRALADCGLAAPFKDADLNRLGKWLGKLHDLDVLQTHLQQHQTKIEPVSDLQQALAAISEQARHLQTKCDSAS